MNAKRESVQFMIFSKKYQEIANAIGMQMDHGVTILDGHGWYTGNEYEVLYPSKEERKRHHLPYRQDHRPKCLCKSEFRNRCVWRGI